LHSTLFYIPDEVYGVPVFGVGWLLAIWGVFSVGLLAWLVWRQGLNADTLSYLLFIVPVAAIIVWLLPILAEEGKGLPIRAYGTMMLVAVLSGTGLAAWRAKRQGIDPDLIVSLAFWMFVPGIIGARAFYVIEYWWEDYWPAFERGGLGTLIAAVLRVDKGGLVVYGSLIGGILGLLLFVRKHRLPLFRICDLIAPSLMLGLALGRIGCFFNGCCFAGPCDHALALHFPAGSPPYHSQVVRGELYGFRLLGDEVDPPVIGRVDSDSAAEQAGLRPNDRLTAIDGRPVTNKLEAVWALNHPEPGREKLLLQVEGRGTLSIPMHHRSLAIHPVQLYSSINALLLCLLLLAYTPFSRRDGEVFALMITVYPVARFLLETIRKDEISVFGTGISISQNVSLGLLVLAGALWVYLLKKPVCSKQ